ncbi:MAG: hypothetical protein GY719_34745 [bacterium]|nr:hypothetical protein [bacterium]
MPQHRRPCLHLAVTMLAALITVAAHAQRLPWTKIDTPFLIATEGELVLAFSDLELVSAAEGAAPCP